MAEAIEKLGIYPSQIYGWRSAQNNNRTGAERELGNSAKGDYYVA